MGIAAAQALFCVDATFLSGYGPAMSIPDRVEILETRCREAGVKVEAVCERAKIDYSTYWRWKAGLQMPKVDVWERFVGAVDALCETTAA